MSTVNADVNKAGSRPDFQLTYTEMVLEIVSLLCIVVSLAIVGVESSRISIQTVILPLLAIIAYVAIGLARRYPRYVSGLMDGGGDSPAGLNKTRETLAWLRTEIVWTILCVQGIILLSGATQSSLTRVIFWASLGLTWIVINGLLLLLIMRISRQQQL